MNISTFRRFIFAVILLALVTNSSVLAATNPGCGVCDVIKDGIIDLRDFAVFASCWMATDDVPPATPQWANQDEILWEGQLSQSGEPSQVGTLNSIEMTAETGFDEWSGSEVQYFFTWQNANIPHLSGDSGWVVNPYYRVDDLEFGQVYAFAFKVRDQMGNQTNFTPLYFVYSGEDTIPPYTPAIGDDKLLRAEFAFDIVLEPEFEFTQEEIYVMMYTTTGPPYSSSRMGDAYPSITMNAEPGLDQGGPIQYKFSRINLENGEILATSDWQDSLTWVDDGEPGNRLIPDQEYTYMVQMRDTAGNEAQPSVPITVLAELFVDDGDMQAPPVPQWAYSVYRYRCTEVNILLGECDKEGTWDVVEAIEVEDAGNSEEGPFEVEYQFMQNCAGSTTYSEWITEPVYEFEVNSFYETASYRVRSRDTSQRRNTSDWGDPSPR